MRKLAEITLASIGMLLILMLLAVPFARAEGVAPAPAPILPVVVPERHPLAGCYGELSSSGQFLAAGDRIATGAVGAGCDIPLAYNAIIGGGTRLDIGEGSSGSFHARLGFLINPHLMVYGLGEWRARDFRFATNGALYLGAGAETTIVVDSLSAFVEASQAVSKFGTDANTIDDLQIRGGLRLRLMSVIK